MNAGRFTIHVIFTVVIVTAVYIPPDADSSKAFSYLLSAINLQQRTYAAYIMATDINHADLMALFPKFEKHTKSATRGLRLSMVITPAYNPWTNWDIFEDQDLEENTITLICYILNCVDKFTIDKHIRVYPNQKPWMTKGGQISPRHNTNLKSCDRDSAARASLRRDKGGIREA